MTDEQSEMPEVIYASTSFAGDCTYGNWHENEATLGGSYPYALIHAHIEPGDAYVESKTEGRKQTVERTHYEGDWPGHGPCGCEKCLHKIIQRQLRAHRKLIEAVMANIGGDCLTLRIARTLAQSQLQEIDDAE